MKRTIIAAALLGAMTAAGCQPAMDMPDGFVIAQERPGDIYHTRAISADGVVCGLRTHESPPKGTLAFWAEAIKNQVTSSKGYKLVKTEPVKSRAGLDGSLMTFSTEQSGVDFTYLAAVFVAKNKVLIVEAGGKADAVTPKLGAIKNAMLTARP